MCEKRTGEEKQDTSRPQPLKRNSSQADRNSHGTSQLKRTNGKTKKKHHARLPAQVPASSVSRNPGGNNRQERKDAVSGQEDGKHREDYREGKHENGYKREKEKYSLPQRVEAKGNGAVGSFEHIDPSHAWQNDVKASVNNTWHISPFCHVLLVGLSCLTEPTASTNILQTHRQIYTTQNFTKHATSTGRESGCQNTTSRHISHSDEPQARQMNFTQDSIEAFYRAAA